MEHLVHLSGYHHSLQDTNVALSESLCKWQRNQVYLVDDKCIENEVDWLLVRLTSPLRVHHKLSVVEVQDCEAPCFRWLNLSVIIWLDLPELVLPIDEKPEREGAFIKWSYFCEEVPNTISLLADDRLGLL